MKQTSITIILVLMTIVCKSQTKMENENFISEKQTRSATILLNANIQDVFPLFGAFEERKWAEGWNPTLIYPSQEIIEEGTTFSTQGRENGEPELLWRVSKFNETQNLIQYLVSTSNRYWTITVKCNPFKDDASKTEATITYTFIGLTDYGNTLNKANIEKMYKNNLKDWQAEINNYLSKL